MFDHMPKILGVTWLRPRPLQGNFLCNRSAFPIQSCTPNLKSLAQVVSRYCALSELGSQVWPFNITWRHRSRDHSIAHMPFPIGGPLEPSLYL